MFFSQTPLHKRIREEKRKSMGAPIYKRKRSFDDSSEEDIDPPNDSKMKRKSSKSSLVGETLRTFLFLSYRLFSMSRLHL